MSAGKIACYSILAASLIILVGIAVFIVILTQTCFIQSCSNHNHKPPEASGLHRKEISWDDNRLVEWIAPEHYDITMYPRIEEGWFSGDAVIHIHVQRNTKSILVHKYLLDITKTVVTNELDEVLPQNSWYHGKNQYWVIELENEMREGKYKLSMSFNGSLTTSIVGFYRSQYTDKTEGIKKYLATTKFEPTFARRAFPCFDEPNKKATWSISVIHHPIKYPTVLSNMPLLASETMADGNTLSHFEKTVPMSTYLVCFIVSEFVSLSQYTKHGVKLSVYTSKHQIQDAKFSLDVAVKTLDYYDDFFGIQFKSMFPKLDMVAIPDFISGAMENWGVITYRESRMLAPEGSTSADHYLVIASVVCHELAHMWFGNIVTMDWWDDLWLNEGFATMMSYTLGMQNYNPKWDTDAQFLQKRMLYVMADDASTSTHPIVQTINNPDDINSAFDSITYSKGAAVIRMLENYLGYGTFKVGIQQYLQRYKYKNAKTDDLWEILGEFSGKDVKGLMDSWTKQEGLPVVIFNSADNSVTQKRFLSNAHISMPELFWKIPVQYRDSLNKQSGVLMPAEDFPTKLNVSKGAQWVKLNTNTKGFFRTNYDKKNWLELSAQLQDEHLVFSTSDRANLIDDVFNLAAAGEVDYEIAFNVIKYLEKEIMMLPWQPVLSQLKYMSNMLRNTHPQTEKMLKQFVITLVDPALEILGWQEKINEPDSTKVLRSSLIYASCYYGSISCIKKANDYFQKWIDNPTLHKLSPVYRSVVYKIGISSKSGAELDMYWNILLKRYGDASGAEQTEMLKALVATNSTEQMLRMLSLADDKETVRDQNYWIMFHGLSYTDIGLNIAFNWLVDHYDLLLNRFGLEDRYFGRAVQIANKFNTNERLLQLQSFINNHPRAGAGKQPRQNALANTKMNIAWVEKYHKIIHNLLLENRML